MCVCVVPFYISQRKGDIFLHSVVDGGSQHPVARLSQLSGCQGEWKKLPEKAETPRLSGWHCTFSQVNYMDVGCTTITKPQISWNTVRCGL